MTNEEKRKIIKNLEHIVAFQNDCLNSGDWESFDRAENEIEKLEKDIISAKIET